MIKRSFHTLGESWFDNAIQDILASGVNQINEYPLVLMLLDIRSVSEIPPPSAVFQLDLP